MRCACAADNIVSPQMLFKLFILASDYRCHIIRNVKTEIDIKHSDRSYFDLLIFKVFIYT